MTELKLTADREGERADALLARLIPDLTRSAAQKLLERGAVTSEGRTVRKNDRPAPGQALEVAGVDGKDVLKKTWLPVALVVLVAVVYTAARVACKGLMI